MRISTKRVFARGDVVYIKESLPRKCGFYYVYVITSKLNKKFYVGVTNDPVYRLNTHKNDRVKLKHLGKPVNWTMTILEKIKVDVPENSWKIYARERDYLRQFLLQNAKNCLNIIGRCNQVEWSAYLSKGVY